MEDRIKKEFGTILIEVREKNNLSQQKLADLADLDRSYISRIERGLISPTIVNLVKISRALKVSPSYLIDEVDSDSSA